MANVTELPAATSGLRLCKIVNEKLLLAETCIFPGGKLSVQMVLNRASVSGKVGPVGETGDFWADVMNEAGDLIETIALDRKSWNSLKNCWMRCRMEPSQ